MSCRGRIVKALFILGASVSVAPGEPFGDGECVAGSTELRWETFARPFFATNCTPCHVWDNYCEVFLFRHSILDQVASGSMPADRLLPRVERDRLAEWINCGLPFAGPECPPAGTAFDFQSFESFFRSRCSSCHSSALQGEDRRGAPPGQDWDNYFAVKEYAPEIIQSLFECSRHPGGAALSAQMNSILEWLSCGAPGSPGNVVYRRGDANDDGVSDVSDAVAVLSFLFLGAIELSCKDAADMDGDGILNISDAVYLLAYRFLGGPPPPQPFELCGTETRLGCATFEHCR